jgi:uncharacterized small protein (DUF1192 family)
LISGVRDTKIMEFEEKIKSLQKEIDKFDSQTASLNKKKH